jgi:threonine/homoserine/homoserine lactone efflux protein
VDAVIAFVVAGIISFWGSLQLGLVNVLVIETALRKGKHTARWIALGGVLPEIPYTLLAIFGTSYLHILQNYKQTTGIVIGLVLLAMGVYYIFKKASLEEYNDDDQPTAKLKPMLKGMALAFANPQLILFWSGILLLIQTGSFNVFGGNEVLIDFNATGIVSPKITFALGAAVGALAILLIYIRLSDIYRDKLLNLLGDKLGKIVGVFFLVLGFFVILKNVI